MRHPLHDYTQACGYFVTSVAYQRANLFGSLLGGEFQPSRFGEAVAAVWSELPAAFPSLTLDAFQLMPDHVHCILIITHLPVSASCATPGYGLPQVMQALKRRSALQINRLRDSPGQRVWQEGYVDRIIRNERELEKYRSYTLTNPLRSNLGR
jgi:REP element-mobilizing transposase RayT